ncbi:MAG: hypothetical protein LBU37_10365, partial [Tannerellaceae bacterium]|nr:hypothetical protein [Tannerellaceae bacterium]
LEPLGEKLEDFYFAVEDASKFYSAYLKDKKDDASDESYIPEDRKEVLRLIDEISTKIKR